MAGGDGHQSESIPDDKRPVERVSWEDVQAFIAKLNELEGEGMYRLPTEAEGEYAARAGGDEASEASPDNAWCVAAVGLLSGCNAGRQPAVVGQRMTAIRTLRCVWCAK